jgi:hypothetical protein
MGRILHFNTGFICDLSYNELCMDILLYGGISNEEREEQHTHVWNAEEDIVYIQTYLQEFTDDCNFTQIDFTKYTASPEGTQELITDLMKNIQTVNSINEIYNYILGCIIYHQLLYTPYLVAKYVC